MWLVLESVTLPEVISGVKFQIRSRLTKLRKMFALYSSGWPLTEFISGIKSRIWGQLTQTRTQIVANNPVGDSLGVIPSEFKTAIRVEINQTRKKLCFRTRVGDPFWKSCQGPNIDGSSTYRLTKHFPRSFQSPTHSSPSSFDHKLTPEIWSKLWNLRLKTRDSQKTKPQLTDPKP